MKAVTNFKRILFITLITFNLNAQSTESSLVGSVKMFNTESIIQNLCKSKDFSSLMKGLIKTEVDSQLMKEGNFTLFAPTNSAFEKLNKTTKEYLFNPENKNILADVLSNHIIVGKLSTYTLDEAIRNGNGKAELKTLSGHTLYVWSKDSEYYLLDEKGVNSKLTISDINQSNGVLHVIDGVLLPIVAP